MRKNIGLMTAAISILPAAVHGQPMDKPIADPQSIGQATMQADGTIYLWLRAESGEAVGDATIVIKRGDKRYQDTLHHLGGLKRGESKPVPPWP
jgi:hypothetical protein